MTKKNDSKRLELLSVGLVGGNLTVVDDLIFSNGEINWI